MQVLCGVFAAVVAAAVVAVVVVGDVEQQHVENLFGKCGDEGWLGEEVHCHL